METDRVRDSRFLKLGLNDLFVAVAFHLIKRTEYSIDYINKLGLWNANSHFIILPASTVACADTQHRYIHILQNVRTRSTLKAYRLIANHIDVFKHTVVISVPLYDAHNVEGIGSDHDDV